METGAWINLLFLILGLVFGSFFSAFSFRYPKEISVARGRSFCPNCKKTISWFDNIPLISYLVLGGKCRSCRRPISLRYPAIELATALGFLIIYLKFAPDFRQIIYSLLLFSILILIFVIDLEHQIIPDALIFLGIFIVFLHLLLTSGSYLLYADIFSGLIAAFFLLLVHLITKGKGMGLGDVKFAILGGMITGINFTFIWMLLSFLTGGAVGSILILSRRAGLKDQIAFGPFLVVGLGLTFLFGDKVLMFLGF